MNFLNFTAFLLLWLACVIVAAPVIDQPRHGDVVGVRISAFEENPSKAVSIHPGVIVGGPHPENGKYAVAMISKKLPHNPPQAPIQEFHATTSTYGNIALSPPKSVAHDAMKPWKDPATGVATTPLTPGGLAKLKSSMAPHAGWRAPSPEPAHSAAVPHAAAHAPATRVPNGYKGPHVNAQPGSSRHPAPAPLHRAPFPASHRPATNPYAPPQHPAAGPPSQYPARTPGSSRRRPSPNRAHPAYQHPSVHPHPSHRPVGHPGSGGPAHPAIHAPGWHPHNPAGPAHPAAHVKSAGGGKGPSSSAARRPDSPGRRGKKDKGKGRSFSPGNRRPSGTKRSVRSR